MLVDRPGHHCPGHYNSMSVNNYLYYSSPAPVQFSAPEMPGYHILKKLNPA